MLRGGLRDFEILAIIPETSTGEIQRWHIGDRQPVIRIGALLCTIEYENLGLFSGKVEILAPNIGTLNIRVRERVQVRPNQLIATIDRGTIV